MGYVHRTPAWAGPLGAKNRTTYWGVVPLKPDGPSRGLPPRPDEVPLAGTFGDWYDAACGYLWRAEQHDLSLVRLLAGGLLILLQAVGLYPLTQLVASAIPGLSTADPDPRTVAAGAVLLVLAWTGWVVYRRRWNRAWELRKAWSWAIHDPRVLELPERPLGAGEERDIGTDPEMTHPYRARLHVRIKDRPFVYRVYDRSHTDRVRGREALRFHVLLLAFLLATLAVVMSPLYGEWGPGQYFMLVVTYLLAVLPPVISAGIRYVRRMRLAQALARVDVEERHRWMGWQLLDDTAVAPGTRPGLRAARAAEEGQRITPSGAAVIFGVFGAIGGLIAWRQQDAGLAVLGGIVLLGLVCLAALVWHGAGRQAEGRTGAGFVVHVDMPGYPRTPRTTVPSGDMVLTLSEGHAHLTPLDSSRPEFSVPVTALISGVGSLLRDGKQWLVLPDDSHVAISCSDYVGLRDAAADAGIPVLLPGPQPL